MSTDTGSADIPRTMRASVLVARGKVRTEERPVPVIQNRELRLTGAFRYTGARPVAAHLAATGQAEPASLITGPFDLDHAEEALNADLTPGSLKAVVQL
jgi:L-iditol 2-dehydrogenase